METDITRLIPNLSALNEEEAQAANAAIDLQYFKRGTVLLEAGQVARFSYIVYEGCARTYFLKDGEEITTAFHTRGQFFTATDSFSKQQTSAEFLACVSDCWLGVLSYQKGIELATTYPRFMALCQVSMEEDIINYQRALAAHQSSSPEERYVQLVSTRPEVLSLAPQHLIASFLGIKAESLSRIRRRMVQKS